MLHKFKVFNTHTSEPIAIIEMDDSLLHPDAGILDHSDHTLRPIKNGSIYTLLPIDDRAISIMNQLRDAYDTIDSKPSKTLHNHFNKLDMLVQTVSMLFNDVEYIIVESAADIESIINPKSDYPHKKVKYNVFTDIIQKLSDS